MPVDASVKFTTNGEQPAKGVAEKDGVGCCAFTLALKQRKKKNKTTVFRINFPGLYASQKRGLVN